MDLEGDLYLGGLPDNRAGLVLPTELWTAMLNYGYVGCVRDLFIDGRSKDIRQIAQSQNMTGIKSSCSKVSGKQCDSNPCKNNGACKEGWNRFVCDCTGTGFWDSTCERGERALQLSLVCVCVCVPGVGLCMFVCALSLLLLIILKCRRVCREAYRFVCKGPFKECTVAVFPVRAEEPICARVVTEECCVTPS